MSPLGELTFYPRSVSGSLVSLGGQEGKDAGLPGLDLSFHGVLFSKTVGRHREVTEQRAGQGSSVVSFS